VHKKGLNIGIKENFRQTEGALFMGSSGAVSKKIVEIEEGESQTWPKDGIG